MSGFYRHTTNHEGEPSFDHAPNFVYAPTFTLLASRDRGKRDEWEYHETAPAWAQPEGAHDLPYHKGDVATTADGQQWQSTVDNNVWKPGESGWRPYVPDGPAPWQQPTGAHDAYTTGDVVTHNGDTWVNKLATNTWEPGVYGWTDLGPA